MGPPIQVHKLVEMGDPEGVLYILLLKALELRVKAMLEVAIQMAEAAEVVKLKKEGSMLEPWIQAATEETEQNGHQEVEIIMPVGVVVVTIRQALQITGMEVSEEAEEAVVAALARPFQAQQIQVEEEAAADPLIYREAPVAQE